MAVFNINGSLIDNTITSECFACDLEKCKGACCTLQGGRGAPVSDDELNDLYNSVPFIRKYLSDQALKIIDTEGWIDGESGSYATPCIDHKDCVYVLYDGDIARCSFEHAYLKNEIPWRKPISCHLFPIRITKNIGDHLHYEKLRECSSGREKGYAQNIKLYDFLKDALLRKYGDKWYDRFHDECKRRNN